MKPVLLCAAFLAAVPAAQARDIWDLAGNDSLGGTENELVDGGDQVHDLEAVAGNADEDWYRLSLLGYSSYEIIVDAITAGLATVPAELPSQALLLSFVPQSDPPIVSAPYGRAGGARVLRLRNDGIAPVENGLVRVASPVCGTSCGPNEQYRIRMLDTTYAVPRFNNTATQVTVLVVQNASQYAVTPTVHFFDTLGGHLGSHTAVLFGNGTLVLNTATVAGVAGQSGSIVVTHDGRSGALAGKAVSLEPATGFTFDTMMVPRAH